MPVLKNPRHERFAQFMAEGKTCVDAYQLAGFKRDDGNSSRLLSAKPEIQARLQELTVELKNRAAKRHEITTDLLVDEIIEASSWAREKRNTRAYVDAVKAKAVLSGKWVEKAEVSTPDDFAAIDAMSRAELVEFILDGIENDIPEILEILLSRQKDVEARAELVASIMSAINGEFTLEPIKLDDK